MRAACAAAADNKTTRKNVHLRLSRSDLTLVCSPVELQLLRDYYGVPAATLALAPLFVPPPPLASGDLPSYGDRRHFVSIGNFKHPPNLDSVRRGQITRVP